MAAAKNSVFIGLYLENYCLVVGGQYGEICLGWEGMRKFLAGVGGGLSPIASSGKNPVYIEFSLRI